MPFEKYVVLQCSDLHLTIKLLQSENDINEYAVSVHPLEVMQLS